jgi:hypothetical protein
VRMHKAVLDRIVSSCRHPNGKGTYMYSAKELQDAVVALANKVESLSLELKEEKETVAELKSKLVIKKENFK